MSLRRTVDMDDIMLSNNRRVSLRPYCIVKLLIGNFMVNLSLSRSTVEDDFVVDVNDCESAAVSADDLRMLREVVVDSLTAFQVGRDEDETTDETRLEDWPETAVLRPRHI